MYFESYCIQQLDSFPVFSWLFPVLCSFFILCDKVSLLFYLIAKKLTYFFSTISANYFYLSKLSRKSRR